MSASTPGLVVRGLSIRLGGRLVVDDVSFEVPHGRVVGLLGPNGAGKTTTFRLIVGLVAQDAGEIILDGAALTGPLHERVRRGLGYLPQGSALFTGLTVRQQLLIPLEARGAPGAEADRLLEDAGLTPLAHTQAAGLSGGERRRLAIARCLATRPRVLLLDEPFAGVDPVATHELVRRFRGLAAQGLGVLLTDHAAREALSACDEVVLLDQGRVVTRGSVEEVSADPRARARWLGEDF
jgi:lipopolysaccharide export system ATP-binding protein